MVSVSLIWQLGHIVRGADAFPKPGSDSLLLLSLQPWTTRCLPPGPLADQARGGRGAAAAGPRGRARHRRGRSEGPARREGAARGGPLPPGGPGRRRGRRGGGTAGLPCSGWTRAACEPSSRTHRCTDSRSSATRSQSEGVCRSVYRFSCLSTICRLLLSWWECMRRKALF